MKYSFIRSIRTQLLILVLLSVLPAFGIVIYSGFDRQRRDIENAKGDALKGLRAVASYHERTVEGTRQFLITLAQLPDVRNRNAAACNKLFASLLRENPIYATIMATTAEGMVFANALPVPPFSITQRNYFNTILRTKKFSAGEYIRGVASRRHVLPFAYPAVDSRGLIRAVVVVGIDLEHYGQMFVRAKLPEGSRFGMFDRKHIRLYRSREPGKYIGKADSPEMIRQMSAPPEEGSFTAVGNDGVKGFMTYKKFYLEGSSSPYLFMRVGVPEEMVLARARQTMVYNLALLSLVFIVVMTFSWFLGDIIIVRRLKKLADVTQRLGQGDLTARTELEHREDELGRVTKSFDEMAGALERNEFNRLTAEKTLRESEEKYRSLASTADIMYLVDRDCRYLLANKKYLERRGLTNDLLIGKKHEELHGEKESRDFHAIVAKVFETNESCQDEHLSDTGGRSLLRTFSPVRDAEGKIIAVTVVGKDITERKRMEEERLHLEERLHRAEKMEALGTLAGGVAHDLNNVLGVLVGYSELLLEKIPEENALRKYASNILQSGQRCAEIIQDLLTLARRGVAVSEIVNLNALVSDYLKSPEFERLKAHHPNVSFRNDLEKDLLNIKGSPIHLRKTVMNLVSNAAEAISGGGEVTLRTENRHIDKPVPGYDEVREGDYAVLTVSDTGKGIPSTDMGRIFEPFYTTKVMGRSGTGLGLAIVWGTVKDHDGYIDVQSEEGRGSAFTIYVPATREELIRDYKEPPPDLYLGKGEMILVVDDVKEQREVAVSMLSRLGYTARAVSGGEDAVEYLKTNPVDLLVLDMIMYTGIDGLETYERILEINPKQKAIIVSGFSETDRVKKAQELGAGDYVRKPYILQKIGLAIRKELDRI